jgi:hypothetical protein
MRDDADYIYARLHRKAENIDYIHAQLHQDITYSRGFRVDLTDTDPVLSKDVIYDNQTFTMQVRVLDRFVTLITNGELQKLEAAINKKTKGNLRKMAREIGTDNPLDFVASHVYWAAASNLPECKELIAEKVLDNQAKAAVAGLVSRNVNVERSRVSL